MVQQIQDLIDKIKSEGVQVADQKAKEVELQSQDKAKSIIAGAQEKADKILAEAKQEIEKMEQASKKAIHQASRDMLLSIRQEICELLGRITAQTMGEALSKDDLVRIITDVVKSVLEASGDIKDVVAFLSPEDQKEISADIISKLQSKLKDGIEVKVANDIAGGFAISFDGGKSSFEFTDKSLAEYLGVFLNAEVGEIMKGAAEE